MNKLFDENIDGGMPTGQGELQAAENLPFDPKIDRAD